MKKNNRIIINAKAICEKNTLYWKQKHYAEKKIDLGIYEVIWTPFVENTNYLMKHYISSNRKDEETATFMNDNYPFIDKPGREEINSSEVQIT